MKIAVNNLFEHSDGGLYCLLSDDAEYNAAAGVWVPGVIFTGTDGRMRATSLDRWEARFSQLPYYDGEDEAVLAMIRRTNPGDVDLDWMRVMEAWGESEVGISGAMLELAVAATAEQFLWGTQTGRPSKSILPRKDDPRKVAGVQLTIGTEDLQRVSQTLEVSKQAIPHAFIYTIRKSFPESD